MGRVEAAGRGPSARQTGQARRGSSRAEGTAVERADRPRSTAASAASPAPEAPHNATHGHVPDTDPRNDLEVVDETGARFLRFWHFVDGRAIPCLIKIAEPERTPSYERGALA